MSADLVAVQPTTGALISFSQEDIDLLKRTVAAEASLTNAELHLFARVAAAKGLDPFSRQIHVAKRKGKLTIQTGIDGYRLIAERTGRWEGIDGPYWCGPDGGWTDVWLSDQPPAAAKVIAYKTGARARTGIAHWREYAQWVEDRDGSGRRLNRMWATMPAGQLAKCAEALALRAQFPQELGGLYTDDEMAQADNPTTAVVDGRAHQSIQQSTPATGAPSVGAPRTPSAGVGNSAREARRTEPKPARAHQSGERGERGAAERAEGSPREAVGDSATIQAGPGAEAPGSAREADARASAGGSSGSVRNTSAAAATSSEPGRFPGPGSDPASEAASAAPPRGSLGDNGGAAGSDSGRGRHDAASSPTAAQEEPSEDRPVGDPAPPSPAPPVGWFTALCDTLGVDRGETADFVATLREAVREQPTQAERIRWLDTVPGPGVQRQLTRRIEAWVEGRDGEEIAR